MALEEKMTLEEMRNVLKKEGIGPYHIYVRGPMDHPLQLFSTILTKARKVDDFRFQNTAAKYILIKGSSLCMWSGSPETRFVRQNVVLSRARSISKRYR